MNNNNSILQTISKREFKKFIIDYMRRPTKDIQFAKFVSFKKDWIIFNMKREIKSDGFCMLFCPNFCRVQSFHTKGRFLYGTYTIGINEFWQVVNYIEYWNSQDEESKKRINYNNIEINK
jgi:hypothetical protein